MIAIVRPVSRGFAIIGKLSATSLALFLACCDGTHHHESSHTLGYSPLDAVVVDIGPGGSPAAIQLLKGFAARGSYEIQDGGFQLPTRSAQVNIEIWVGKDSSFYANNFLRSDELLIVAYSHENPSVWGPAWRLLDAHLSARYPVRRLAITAKGVVF